MAVTLSQHSSLTKISIGIIIPRLAVTGVMQSFLATLWLCRSTWITTRVSSMCLSERVYLQFLTWNWVCSHQRQQAIGIKWIITFILVSFHIASPPSFNTSIINLALHHSQTTIRQCRNPGQQHRNIIKPSSSKPCREPFHLAELETATRLPVIQNSTTTKARRTRTASSQTVISSVARYAVSTISDEEK